MAVQRQVQLDGPDAGRLAQALVARDLSGQAVGQGKYAPVCDHRGVLLNDPIVLKLAEDRYWLSIGDSDIWFWARCVAGERGLDVDVSEPDVSPLAVQGPKAEDVVAALLGDWVRDIRFFWFADAEVGGAPLKVMRSGWSKQGGFELYLLDGSRGDALWRMVKDAGRPFDIGPGYPDPAESIESGLLDWGVDTDAATNPFEVRLGRYVDLHLSEDEVIGVRALRRIDAAGPRRRQMGVVMASAPEAADQELKSSILRDGATVGVLTRRAWSYRMGRMIGLALVDVAAAAGDSVRVMRGDQAIDGELVTLLFAI